ncbi:MAG: aldehyde ferredoxin oxidoreductase C-terminal domain-containing protein, partial [Methanosarcinales archaeon]
GDTACFSCPMACGNVCLVKDGKYLGTVTEGPEYETACMFGSNVGISDFSAILRANYLCDELGVDTISTGNLIAVVIEGYESGILSLEDLDGVAIKWGEDEPILALIEKIAKREGIGNILAEGSLALIEKYPELKPIISQVKGLEQSAYDARVGVTMALGYATSDIGAHHTRAWPLAKEIELGKEWSLEERADLVIYHQTVRPLFDMLGVCRLPWIELGFPENIYAEFYSAATGVKVTLQDLLDKSKKVYDLTRCLNVKLGITKKDDYPPDRVFNHPIKTGPQAGAALDRDTYEKLLDIYYKKRDWNEEGIPRNGCE